MPAIIHARVVLEGRSEHDPGSEVQADMTCIRGLLDDVFAIHSAGYESSFGAVTVQGLLSEWQQNGLRSFQIPAWVEKLRKAAFEAENLGEASMEIRNHRDLPDGMPGVVPALCAILDYFAGCCGSDGVVMLVFPDEV